MIRDAQEYGSLNVHMRSQRTDLFSAGTYNLLASATDYENLTQMLANTQYNDIIGTEMDKKYPNLLVVDRRLSQHFVDQYNIFRKFIPKRAKEFVDLLSRSYFLNNVKVILAALHGASNYEEAQEMLLNLTPVENEETEHLYKAQNVEDMISRLTDEKLRESLENVLGEYRFLDLVYPLIVAVDQYFYEHLSKEMSKLKGEDRNKIKMLTGSRIGIQNIEIILRSKLFNIVPGMIRKWLIATKMCPLKEDFREKLISAPDMEAAFNLLKEESPFSELGVRLLENLEKEKPPLDNFDRFADQILIHKANSIFRGASFNVSVFPAFFFLKEMEIRNLRVIILGKLHKRSTNEILEKIVLV